MVRGLMRDTAPHGGTGTAEEVDLIVLAIRGQRAVWKRVGPTTGGPLPLESPPPRRHNLPEQCYRMGIKCSNR